jgi:uncharacterized membrane protein YbhN (UPF0104 family)
VFRLLRMARLVVHRSGIVGRLRPYASWLGIAVAATVVAGSFVVLANQLKDIDFAQVAQAMRAHPPHRLALAAAFIVCAYATLTCYDWFALKTIGAIHVPYWMAAMASFASYSIGHNVGATAFSGGAIRYRIYSSRGLTVVDVAKMCFVTGLTFWLGNLTVLGFGMICAPEAASRVDQLPPGLNRAIGIGALCALVGYVAWVSYGARRIGRDNWTLALPGRASTLLQVGIGFLDLSLCSLAMYMLMPSEPQFGFVTVAVVFVSATLLGFASHSPGSLGVFDAAMVFAFAEVDKESLVAALLLFRLMYFLSPFTLALAIMCVREAMIMVRQRRSPAPRDKTSSPAGTL